MRPDDAGLPELAALVQRVREEVARRRGEAPVSPVRRTPIASSTVAARQVHLSPAPLTNAPAYRLDQLLAFHDRDFVRQAYLAVLKRPPDAAGEAHYLGKLRGGALTQVEIIGRLRYSPEGKQRHVKIAGLLLPLALRQLTRVPVLGYAIALGTTVLRLPVLLRNLQTFEAHTFQVQAQLAESLNASHALQASMQQDLDGLQQEAGDARQRLDHTLAAIEMQVGGMHTDLVQRLGMVDALRTQVEALHASVENAVRREDLDAALQAMHEAAQAQAERVAALQAQLAFVGAQTTEHLRRVSAVQADSDAIKEVLERQHHRADALQQALTPMQDAPQIVARLEHRVADQHHQLLDTQRRITLLLEEARKRLSEPLSGEQLARIVAEDDHMLDAFYVSFENQFRGTREEIKQRAAYYVPTVTAADAGVEAAPVLDLGCGRGEWLEVLQDHGLTARGIDLNRIMVQQCLDAGLQATEVDAIAYLRGIGANTLGAVTAMHLIEHLPFRTLVTLFDEALRVLRPGGVLIFETPNPENVSVGACNFYMDPTHRNPLPPPLVQFIAEARGFVGVEIHRLSDGRGPVLAPALLGSEVPGSTEVNAVLGELHHLLASAPDYAIIARKA